jgi:hypothetical protein
MKPKYSIGQQVKIKATGEKVKILRYKDGGITQTLYRVSTNESYWESELKPFRPSRTGKYRNEKGQFVSKETNKCKGCGVDLLAQEQQDYFTYPDSKQRNYQKKDQQWFDHDYIIKSLERIEKKIDELRRKV